MLRNSPTFLQEYIYIYIPKKEKKSDINENEKKNNEEKSTRREKGNEKQLIALLLVSSKKKKKMAHFEAPPMKKDFSSCINWPGRVAFPSYFSFSKFVAFFFLLLLLRGFPFDN